METDESFIGSLLERHALSYLEKKKNDETFTSFGIKGSPDIFEIDEEKKTIYIGEIKCPKASKDLELLRKSTYT